MAIFVDYSKYYDLLYRDKDYRSEVDYVDNLIKKYSTREVKNLLDIGCGTGSHAAFFAKKEYELVGIDQSSEMNKAARKKKISGADFRIADARSFDLKRQFDTVLTLFHVLDYNLTDQDLNRAIKQVTKHLKPGGLFIFDCWYGPCVEAEPPRLRSKELEDEEAQIIRLAVPDFYPEKHQVDVNYEIVVLNKKTHGHSRIKETHKVRYFYQDEIEKVLGQHRIEILTAEEWLTGEKPSKKTFSVCFVGKLKE